MLERRSLRAPITLGVVMIVLVVILLAIWIGGNIYAVTDPNSGYLWIVVGTGIVLLGAVLAGVIAYLTLTVKAFNLNRRQSNFIDSVTHELKSPIASLKLYLQTMARRPVSDEQRQDFHKFMLDDVERLDALINHLLDVARVDRVIAESKDDDRRAFRLDELLTQCGEAACMRYGVPHESVSLAGPPVVLEGAMVQTEILFRNLIDNAIKYGGDPPCVEIQIETLDDPHKVRVSVSDNGAGIPADQRRKVFGRFVRLGSELERSRPGTGLGLYLVRNITKSLRGTVRVIDRREDSSSADGSNAAAVDSGSRFEVTLPGRTPDAPTPGS